MKASIQAAKKLTLKEMVNDEQIPEYSVLGSHAKSIPGCSIEMRSTENDASSLPTDQREEETNARHINMAANSIELTSSYGFFLRDWNVELGNRIVELFLNSQKKFFILGEELLPGRSKKGPILKAFNKETILEYSLSGKFLF